MIKLLDDLSLLEQFSVSEPYLACLFNAEGAALLPTPELMSVWVETGEHGVPVSAVKVDPDEIVLLSGEGGPGIEMFFFLTKLCEGGIKRITCGEGALSVLKKLFPAKAEELPVLERKAPSTLRAAPLKFVKTKTLKACLSL